MRDDAQDSCVRTLRTRAPRGTGTGGFALIELVVAIAILAVAFAGISTSLASSMSLRRSNQETARAVRAALGVAEVLRDETFDEVFARFNADPDDDPDGIGTAPGQNFAVPGLAAQDGDADGFVGRIVFPGDGLTLREDVASRDHGMPRDLNGDGDALDAVEADYQVLPLTIVVAWQGSRGQSSIQLPTILTAR